MHSKKELRSVALMDTPESLKLGSHDPRRKVQRRPSPADKMVTGRRQRGDVIEASATITWIYLDHLEETLLKFLATVGLPINSVSSANFKKYFFDFFK